MMLSMIPSFLNDVINGSHLAEWCYQWFSPCLMILSMVSYFLMALLKIYFYLYEWWHLSLCCHRWGLSPEVDDLVCYALWNALCEEGQPASHYHENWWLLTPFLILQTIGTSFSYTWNVTGTVFFISKYSLKFCWDCETCCIYLRSVAIIFVLQTADITLKLPGPAAGVDGYLTATIA